MTDLEMIKKCAEKMGIELCKRHSVNDAHIFDPDDGEWGRCISYDPLTNDAQAMALVKKFGLSIVKLNNWLVSDKPNGKNATGSKDLNRAIVECVSKLPD